MTAPVPGPPVPGPPVPRLAVPGPPVHGLAAGPTLSDSTTPGVLRALARLDELDQRPVAEHVEVFDGVHRLLQDALATLDEV